jgi:hypothetical protein
LNWFNQKIQMTNDKYLTTDTDHGHGHENQCQSSKFKWSNLWERGKRALSGMSFGQQPVEM